MKFTRCLVCKGKKFSKVRGTLRDNPEIGILKCDRCGLVTLESFTHIDEDFYEKSKMRSLTGNGISFSKWKALNKAFEKDDERRFKQFYNSINSKTVLDFGAGAGGFLLKAKSVAKQVYGIELDSCLSGYLNMECVPTYKDSKDIEKDLRGEKIDTVTMFHVLEHIINPKKVLLSLKDLLAENGKIIIEVPNSEDALISLYESEPFSNFTYWGCHVFLYNSYNLKLLAEQLGFKVQYIKQYQRYTISNHLYWLSKGKPGGHEEWGHLDTDELNNAYCSTLAAQGKCDTLIMSIGL